VTYSTDINCNDSQKAAELLSAKGFTVSIYKGGAREWVAAGLPVEKHVEKVAAKNDNLGFGAGKFGEKPFAKNKQTGFDSEEAESMK
jgi:3-mercaptopyruvate sulfurtransferase SseA